MNQPATPAQPVADALDQAQGQKLAADVGLLPHEYEAIEAALGRPPGRTELTLFAGMWSEHCAYKSTRQWLRHLPHKAPHVLAGPGSHAGAVDVGEGWAVAFKVESHNHPSAVEPYQGAATGVGGILRDIIAQGARPCAVMDALCFGEPDGEGVQHIARGVVDGIAGYGNAFGIPNVGGAVTYDARYQGNPLVNALAAGLVRHDGMHTANAKGHGNVVLYAGARTGRDGILGAAFASEELEADNADSRPRVQVGDPFMGKKLLEACMGFGPQMGLVACQDMGACGLTCAATEMAAAGNVGIDLELDDIPLRENDMAPHEVLLSESQERFLFVVQKDAAEKALAHFRSHGVCAVICGKVVAGDRVHIRHGEKLFVDVPAALVADHSPLANWPVAEALPQTEAYTPFDLSAPDLSQPLAKILALPSIGSKQALFDRYDQTVGNRSVRTMEQAEASVLKLPKSKRGFALRLLMDGDACGADPRQGIQALLGRGLRDLACVGASMTAITDGLNMASPQDPIENLRLRETIEGLGEGLATLNIPVTGGNVSLYNESPKGPIPPTPMVGCLGLVDDIGQLPGSTWQAGQAVVLLGALPQGPAQSVYGRMQTGQDSCDKVDVDLHADAALAAVLVAACTDGLVAAAKDSGHGGALVALSKLAIRSNLGVHLDAALPSSTAQASTRKDWAWFGENSGVAWLACDKKNLPAVQALAHEHNVPFWHGGYVQGDAVTVTGIVDAPLEKLQNAYNHASWVAADRTNPNTHAQTKEM